MEVNKNLKADCLKLFQNGFIPANIPLTGDRDTIARYYRDWKATGGKCPKWRRLAIKVICA